MTMLDIIEKKELGKELNGDEIRFFAEAAAQKTAPDYQLAAMLMIAKTAYLDLFAEFSADHALEMLAEEDPEYFYKNLAFAFALGVTSVYAEHFASLATKPPEWYESTMIHTGGSPVNSMGFLNSVDGMMTRISSTMTSSPSSGGGGGSFSGGGGGGGGGGGSW